MDQAAGRGMNQRLILISPSSSCLNLARMPRVIDGRMENGWTKGGFFFKIIKVLGGEIYLEKL